MCVCVCVCVCVALLFCSNRFAQSAWAEEDADLISGER